MIRTQRRQAGFTLLEVIIAMIIMSFLSLFTFEAIQRALKTKAKIQTQIDKNSTLRDALRIMERDINMAFNYHDSYIELYNQTQAFRKQAATAKNNAALTNQPAGYAPATTIPRDDLYKLKTEKIYTKFIGDQQKVDFTTLSNSRMMENSDISQQAEVGYKLQSCRRRSDQQASTNCLWRRSSNYIHDDITKEGQQTVLLENVIDFKLRYLGPGKEEHWVDQWASEEHGDDVTRNKFPYAVEITIAIRDDQAKTKDKELRMTMVAAIRNPNNPIDPKDPNAAGAAGKNGQGGATATPGSPNPSGVGGK